MRPKPSVRSLGPSLPRVPFALALRRRPRLRWALVALVALCVGLLVQGTVSGADRTRAAWGRTRTVLVATRDLPAGHVLVGGDATARQVPAALAPPGALAAVPVGRTVRIAVLDGEVLVGRRLSASGVSGVAARLPAGTRAVAVPTEPGTSPRLLVGQRVDVVAVAASSDGPAPGFVLARAALVVDVREDAAAVAVDPAVVPRIAVALAEGAVSLALVAP
jgi:Flp pilus assembly protein CpaB